MEHVLLDFFVVDGIVYQCRSASSCLVCSCYNRTTKRCEDIANKMGSCSRGVRRDDKDVVFVKVGEVDAPFVITSDMLKR